MKNRKSIPRTSDIRSGGKAHSLNRMGRLSLVQIVEFSPAFRVLLELVVVGLPKLHH